MNREIKFRVWDKEHNKMLPTFTLLEAIIRHSSPEMAICEFMQYTELKDKNGKEIYEGDVVVYEFNNRTYRIEFLNGEFLLRRKFKNIENKVFDEVDYGKEIEIIGNIYENPELLNSQN